MDAKPLEAYITRHWTRPAVRVTQAQIRIEDPSGESYWKTYEIPHTVLKTGDTLTLTLRLSIDNATT